MENLGGVEALMLKTTRLNMRPGKGGPDGHKHAKRMLLLKEIWFEARTQLDQEVVHDGTYTEHRGDKQLRELHDNLPSSRCVVWRPWWTPPAPACGSLSSSRKRSA